MKKTYLQLSLKCNPSYNDFRWFNPVLREQAEELLSRTDVHGHGSKCADEEDTYRMCSQ